MIETLRRMALEVAEAPDPRSAVAGAVRRLHQASRADAAVIFASETAGGPLVAHEAVGLGTGADREEGLRDATRLAERVRTAGEARRTVGPRGVPWGALLAVPVVHRRRVAGVLAVARRARRPFSARDESFLVTASALLAETVAECVAAPRVPDPRSATDLVLRGTASAPGVAIGTVLLPSPLADLDAVPDRRASDPEAEEAAFLDAVMAVQRDVEAGARRMESLLPSETAAVFEVYRMLAGDESLAARVRERIQGGQSAPAALRDAIGELAAALESAADERLRARAEDVRAVGRSLLLALRVEEVEPGDLPRRVVLAGDEVSIASIARVPRERLAGVVCFHGSALSHTAIVVRALGVPAVMGLGAGQRESLAGRTAVVDGYRGRVIVEPGPAVREEFARLEREERELADSLRALATEPAVTADGVHVPLMANAGLLTDLSPALAAGADGVGLYRSEFPFMLRESFPSEDEQLAVYREALGAFAPRPVTIRTLDVGGDKPLPYFPIDEPNSLLGWRGLRVTLQHPEIFVTQLKAMLRADAGLGNLRVLLPMVATAREVAEARAVLEQAAESLARAGAPVARLPPVGVMLEVPAALYQLEELSRAADFFSLGTNDLTQYMLAVDRGNARVAALYDHLHPAVLRAIDEAVRRARELDRPVGVCGELAGDPAGAALLLGLGLAELSVAASALARVKWLVRAFSTGRSRELLDRALRLPDGVSVRRLAEGAILEVGLGALIRAGR